MGLITTEMLNKNEGVGGHNELNNCRQSTFARTINGDSRGGSKMSLYTSD